jgi:hypothetical protein
MAKTRTSGTTSSESSKTLMSKRRHHFGRRRRLRTLLALPNQEARHATERACHPRTGSSWRHDRVSSAWDGSPQGDPGGEMEIPHLEVAGAGIGVALERIGLRAEVAAAEVAGAEADARGMGNGNVGGDPGVREPQRPRRSRRCRGSSRRYCSRWGRREQPRREPLPASIRSLRRSFRDRGERAMPATPPEKPTEKLMLLPLHGATRPLDEADRCVRPGARSVG